MQNPFLEPITYLGETAGRNPGRRFGIYQSDRLFHTYIIGQTGTGKSTLLLNMAKQDIEAGRGFCLLDPHGDLAEAVAAELEVKGIYWDLADPASPYGYNPLAYVTDEYRPLVASAIIDTLKNQWSDAWGARMEHLLRYALLALLEYPNSTIADIIPLFTKRAFRTRVLKYVTDDQVMKFWQDEFPNMNYKNSADGVAPIANKLGAFLANPIVRKAICDPDKPLRFRQLMDQGSPLVVNLSKGRLGTDVSNVLGGLIASMMANAAYTRAITPEDLRQPYFLYADEFHNFTTETFAGMLSELRKYKLGLVLAHQHCSQLDRKVHEAILGNVGTQIIFRLGASDICLMARSFEKAKATDLLNIPNYRNFIRLMIAGRTSNEFSTTTLVAKNKQTNNSH